ncbi:uncharacterized protein LOC130126086 [Lampris incognitus]|uniref:uncharacterized protein LOC130126086 n=1 Tax=Lampris incognitus TaxID=2546036 RepID=UPI0024B4C208|nr:uncharacterized protein LOC130126086 [Lampris incognitus]
MPRSQPLRTNSMIIVFLSITAYALVSGSSLRDQVHQTPADMVLDNNTAQTPTITCRHTIDGYNRILWYKQLKNGTIVKGPQLDTAMIHDVFLTVSFSLLSIKGLAAGSDPPVTQTTVLWRNVSQSATIDCNHTKGASYNQMYWYQHVPGEGMKLIVFTSTSRADHDFGDNSQEKYSATKTAAERGTFTVKHLEAVDSALYFCAIYEHSGTDELQGFIKT